MTIQDRREDFTDLRGRVFVVTGAGGVIGSAVARRLASCGALIALADIIAPTDLESELCGSAAWAVDVRDPGAVSSLFEQTMRVFGRINGVVNAAGITSAGAFESITLDEWERVQAINLRGVFLCCQAALGPLRAQGGGRIINIGSVVAKNGGNPRPWLDPNELARAANAAYAAAKAGVHAMTLSLAKEAAQWNITVNAVAPGPIAGPMTKSFPDQLRDVIPQRRLGRPENVAAACAYLCSDDADFVTGEILDVNGGLWVD